MRKCILFIDDMVIISELRKQAYDKLEQWRKEFESYALKISKSNQYVTE